MNELALFAGGGLGLLGSRLLGWRTVCYVENNSYCVEILRARIRDGYLDDSPIWGDVCTFDGRPWAGYVDIVTAGFPCQPWSGAGSRKGEKDRRNLWPETYRILTEVRPEWVLLENVPRLLCFSYAQKIFADLAQGGFDCRWDLIPAAAVGASHLRYRLWIVAHSNRQQYQGYPLEDGRPAASELLSYADRLRLQGESGLGEGRRRGQGTPEQFCKALANPHGKEQQLYQPGQHREVFERAYAGPERWWRTEPRLGRVAYGVPYRVDRLRALGNGQVPAMVPLVWSLLSGGFGCG